jgi:hypothetical protein
MMDANGTCPGEGIFGINGDKGCTKFIKCVRTINKFLMPLLMKCPPGYQYLFEMGKCMRESTLRKMGLKCPTEKSRSSLEESFSSETGLPAIYLNPELVEGSEQEQFLSRYGALALSSSDDSLQSRSLVL